PAPTCRSFPASRQRAPRDPCPPLLTTASGQGRALPRQLRTRAPGTRGGRARRLDPVDLRARPPARALPLRAWTPCLRPRPARPLAPRDLRPPTLLRRARHAP